MTTQARGTFSLLPNLTLNDSIAHLKSQGIKFVRLLCVDYSNLIRYRIVPIKHLATAAGNRFLESAECTTERIAESGTGMVPFALAAGPRDNLVESILESGDVDFKPDLETVWRAPFAPSHAYMTGRLFEKPYYGGGDSDRCPRTILQRVLQRAEKDFGAKFLVGFETEFVLLDQNDQPVSGKGWWTSEKLQCGPIADCIHEIAEGIIEAGIDLETYHAESTSGQYEVVTGPLPPLQAADTLVATREIVYNIAKKHGYRATLAPKPFINQAGSASHVHISIQSPRSKTPSNHPDIPSLPADLASLMAGILEHLSTICMFTLPVDASYDRVGDGSRGGGAWVSWGRENKDVPIRLCGSGRNFNIEVKTLDGIANPYLALAAILGAGLTALESDKPLEMRNCLVTVSDLPDHEREAMGITTRMPKQSPLFEPGLEGRMKFIHSWLPERAWGYFKAARESERRTLESYKKDDPDASWHELSAKLCLECY